MGKTAVVSGMRRGIVAGAIALAALVPASAGAEASSAGDWNLFYQARVSGYFADVAVISKTDAWAVADLINSHGQVFQPFVRQWNGRSWNAVTIPGASGFGSDWVAASSATNVWVMGLTSSGNNPTKAYRYDGSRWHAVPVPAQTWLTDPVVSGPGDVWALGSSGLSSSDIFHWNGTRWVGYSVGVNLQEISGTWAKDLWAVGLTSFESNAPLAAYYWNGSRWRTVSMPHPVSADGGIHVSSISDIWVGGSTTSSIYVLHWNGSTWREVAATSSLPANENYLVPDGSGGLWLGPLAHWTGRVWQGPVPFSPSSASRSSGPMAHVPGTSSYWAVTGTTDFGSTQEEPTIYLYGPVP
jgi:hypothetical protein